MTPTPSTRPAPSSRPCARSTAEIGDRVGSFTDRTRLAKLLDLMTLDMLGKADGRDWADRLYLAGGRPANQRPHDDGDSVSGRIHPIE